MISACGHTNPERANFCLECGVPLAMRCARCGIELPPAANFCLNCGAKIVARPPPGDATAAVGARKVVTIVFADLVGSTALHERLDAESARRFMERYYEVTRAAVEAHAGTVTQLLGDGVMAVFGVPNIAEDDAIRAVRAAVAMQEAFRALATQQSGVVGATGLRVAVNTGEVVLKEGSEVIGDPVNVAARLQEQGGDGDVVIGEATRRLVVALVTLAPLGSITLKGRAGAVAAYRVVSLEPPAGAAATPFVGRENELARLTAVYDAAVAAGGARLAVLLGSPGLGKSRLAAELAARLGDAATVLTSHCDAAGGTTFAPIAQALRAFLHLDDGVSGEALRAAVAAALPGDDSDRARVVGGIAALLAGTPASPEESFFVVRRFLARFAAVRPMVLVIDDLHWAEPLLLDLVEHLVEWGGGVPLFVLAAARPELRERRSSLTTPGGIVTDVVTLAGLDAGAATRLAANMIGASDLPAAVAAKVLATSEGNPLFVGELVRMLVHEGALLRDGERWIVGAGLAALEMPPTIHALLAARIERLRPEERTVLERAAVLGRHFSRSAVAELMGRDASELDARLEALRRSDLVERDAGWFLGEPAWRFHHVLIRDAAYRRLLKETRADMHARTADWIVARVGEAVEHDEAIGWHLEQAHQYLRELGPLDATGRVLGERAARYLAAAGRRALGRDDLLPAASLVGRALDRLAAEDPGRAELVLDWCEALLAAGDVGAAARAIAELARLMADSERLRAWHACFSGQLAVLTDPQALYASEGAVAAAAETMAVVGDTAGEAKAHAIHALVLAQLGKIGACEAALDQALAAARRAHDRRRANAVLAGAPLAALWGPSPVTRASGRCLDVVRVLRITQGAPAVEAVALRCQAVLETLRGRAEAARRMIASSRHLVEELGITQRVLEADLFAGLIELLEGDVSAAEPLLQSAWDGLRAEGLGIDAAQAGALLARALLAQGGVDEADGVSRESEALAGDSFKAAIAWRGVRAEVLAARGDHAAAVELARAAVAVAAATDDLLDHADARASLAVALRAAGQGAEADAEERHAIALWEAKGATLLVERARRATLTSVASTKTPVAVTPSAVATRRRVPENQATLALARFDEAVAARDLQAVARLLGDARMVDHVYGHAYGSDTLLDRFRWLIESSADLAFRNEPITVLGPLLTLSRWCETGAAVDTGELAVGPYELAGTVMVEADSEARMLCVESFAPDKLGDAVVRLYERHAEQLPDGPERTRAAAVARTLAAYSGPIGLERWAATWAPDIAYVDRRTIGLEPARGSAAIRRVLASLLEAAPDATQHFDDVLAARPDAWLVRNTNSGTDRTTGGAYERVYLLLMTTDQDGLVTRIEQFDADREAEALARFDALTVPRAHAPVTRRVRPNAATRGTDAVLAAFAARDLDATAALVADDVVNVHHPTGVVHGRDGALASWRELMGSPGSRFEFEAIATLGDWLVLGHVRIEVRGDQFGIDVGETELLWQLLQEWGPDGRSHRAEAFADDRLGDAVVRLYERHAELLPEGPERDRAAAVARSAAALAGPLDVARFAAAFAPTMEFADHRALGLESVRGAEAVLGVIASLLDGAPDAANRIDDVVALCSEAMLLRMTNHGTLRLGGGAYERPGLVLWIFGADGLVTRSEQFDLGHEVEALARFDARTAKARPAVRRVRANRVTAVVSALEAAMSSRDAEAFSRLVEDDYVLVNHVNGGTYGREGTLSGFRELLEAERPFYRHEPLATLGESLGLLRLSLAASGAVRGDLEFGPWEIEELILYETGESGLRHATVFAPDRLGDAVVRLYVRYAELLPDGPERTRAAAVARTIAVSSGPMDLERWAAIWAPDIAFVDRRTIGLEPTRASAAFRRVVASLLEAAPDATNRFDDVLTVRPDAWLVRNTNSGTDHTTGGAYERVYLVLWTTDRDGLVTRIEQFDPDREVEALARFDELTASSPAPRAVARRVRPNAATASAARRDQAQAERDLDAFAALIAEEYEFVDHTTGYSYGRSQHLDHLRRQFQSCDLTHRREALATLGDFLVLDRSAWSASGSAGTTFDVGPWEVGKLLLSEVGADGRQRRSELFGERQLGDAVARLYERHAELLPEGRERERAAVIARAVAVWNGPPNLDRIATCVAPSFESVDHQSLRFWSAQGSDAWLQHVRAHLELAAPAAPRDHEILALASDAFLVRRTWPGHVLASGGTFENHSLALIVFGGDGLTTHAEWFDLEREAEALARFDELTATRQPAPRRARANAATASATRLEAVLAARDADAIADFFSDDFEGLDHTTGASYDRAGAIVTTRGSLAHRGMTLRHEPLATLGERLMLCRYLFTSSGVARGGFDIGPLEVEKVMLLEVDEHGRRRRNEWFAPEHLADAIACLYERHAELLPEGPGRTRAEATARSVAFYKGPLTLERYAAIYASDVERVDRRTMVGTGHTRGIEAILRGHRAVVEMSETLEGRIEGRVDDVLALGDDRLLLRWTNFGTLRDGGGPYERSFLALSVYGPDGLVTRSEWFDADQDAAAFARFDALAAQAPAVGSQSRPG